MHYTGTLPSILLSLLLLVSPAYTKERAWIDTTKQNGYSDNHHKSNDQETASKQPIIVRKMPAHDPGQMLFLSDWQVDDLFDLESNMTTTALELPFLPHQVSRKPAHGLNRFLFPRASSGFSCPSGTNSCASIGASYGCCPQGTTCQLASNGDLGCCPGSTGSCAGSTPTNCEAGYSSCSLFHGGGGCCASGFQCQSQGCVGVSTTVVVVYPTVTVTQSSSISSSVVIVTSSSTSSTTVPASTSTTTVIVSSTTSTSSSSSTPVSSTIIISTSTSTPSPSSPSTSTVPEIPIAPTSLSLTTSTASQPTTLFLNACPTGYYACSAVYNLGACCQVGRDCDRTSCPALITSTALVSNGVTIADISATAACATGWSTCGTNVGGGCCPSGYACGTQLCSATGTASAAAGASSVVAKEGSASVVALRMSGLAFGVLTFWLGAFLT